MNNFLQRRACLLIEEARKLAAEGSGREACRRVLATCDFLGDSFDHIHRELPSLFQLLSDLHDALGESREAERYQIRAWELQRCRERQIRRLLAISRLSDGRLLTASDPRRWPPSVGALFGRIRDDTLLDPAPEVLIFGPPGSGKTHLLHSLGHEAIDRPWPTRLCLGYELLETLSRARRILQLHRELLRLDRYRVLLVDEVDPWSLKPEESEVFHAALLHRRDRRCTVLAVRTKRCSEAGRIVASLRRTKVLRSLSSGVVLLGLGGVERW